MTAYTKFLWGLVPVLCFPGGAAAQQDFSSVSYEDGKQYLGSEGLMGVLMPTQP